MDVVLVGLPGSGKSVVGRRLAHRHGATFIDLDERIESGAGRSIPEIFAEDGEAAFRATRAGGRSPTSGPADPAPDVRRVIATGGGAVVDPRNRWALYRGRTAVWLDGRPEVLAQRLRRSPHVRPLVTGRDPIGTIRDLGARRERVLRAPPTIHQLGVAEVHGVVDAVDERIAWIAADAAPTLAATTLLRADDADRSDRARRRDRRGRAGRRARRGSRPGGRSSSASPAPGPPSGERLAARPARARPRGRRRSCCPRARRRSAWRSSRPPPASSPALRVEPRRAARRRRRRRARRCGRLPRRDLPARRSGSSRSRRRSSPRSTRRSAARPASTCPRARTWSGRSTSRARSSSTSRRSGPSPSASSGPPSARRSRWRPSATSGCSSCSSRTGRPSPAAIRPTFDVGRRRRAGRALPPGRRSRS